MAQPFHSYAHWLCASSVSVGDRWLTGGPQHGLVGC